MTRKICVLTATRAEYGLLYWLLRELLGDRHVELQLVVAGAHLSDRFGHTVTQIEEDGFPIAARVPMAVEDDSTLGVTRSLAAATEGLGDAFARLAPDLLVVLGDRYEVLAAAQAAMIARIPIAHIHGGESTEGAIDEAIRHAVSKMAHLHFVAADAFRQRVIQLGEAPERVWTVGAMGLDNIARLRLLDRDALRRSLDFELGSPSFLVTYHPATLGGRPPGEAMRTLLQALDESGASIVITGVNADPGSSAVRLEAENFAAQRAGRVLLVETLGALRYLSLMVAVDAVVGNSSSGLLEAPTLGVATVDVGERQRGRPRAPSVIHCDEDLASIRSALRTAISPEHRAVVSRRETPYGEAGAAVRVATILRDHPLEGLLVKRFHDLHVPSA